LSTALPLAVIASRLNYQARKPYLLFFLAAFFLTFFLTAFFFLAAFFFAITLPPFQAMVDQLAQSLKLLNVACTARAYVNLHTRTARIPSFVRKGNSFEYALTRIQRCNLTVPIIHTYSRTTPDIPPFLQVLLSKGRIIDVRFPFWFLSFLIG
jgi:hypothetical protein